MSDIDADLKNLFDERLGGLNPPPRSRRHARRRGGRVAAVAATAALALTAAFAMEVNAFADATGMGCADFQTKVQVWAQGHWSNPFGDHSAAKAELANMVAASGCSVHDSNHDASHSGGPHH